MPGVVRLCAGPAVTGVTLKISRCIMGIALAVAAWSASAWAETPLDVQRIILEESANSRVPPALALALARVESNFDPRAVSPVGAKGVMQLMPKTAREVFGVREEELWNPRLNIQLGIGYLEQLHDQYGGRWDLALSHYNGGTLAGGSGAAAVPHDYTRKYVADVLRWQRIYSAAVFEQPQTHQIQWTRAPLRPRPAPPSTTHGAAEPWKAAPDRPWRKGQAIDPLEFNDWAEVEQRRLMMRRGLDDFTRTD